MLYFDPLAFLPTTPGCTEHQLKLSSILNEAQAKHKALAVSGQCGWDGSPGRRHYHLSS